MELFKSIQKIQNKTPVQAPQQPHQTSEEGFVMIISLAIIPLLLCICFLLVAYSNYSYISLTALNTCRKHLLTGQDKVRLEMVKLIDINPRAKNARQLFKKAKDAFKNSPNPVTAAALAAATTYQLMIAGEQKIHISKAKLHGLNYTSRLIKDLKKLNHDSRITVGVIPFALKSTPKLSLSPDYIEKYNFQKQQEVKASWTMKNYNQKFTNSIINGANSPNIIGGCGATIDNKEGKKWKAILTKKGKL